MEREPRRRKSVANRRPRRHGGSSSNPNPNEERMVRPFPPNIRFGHEGQRNKFNQLMSRQFAPMKYLSSSSLQRVGLLNEVNMYVSRMGWEAFVLMKHPTYDATHKASKEARPCQFRAWPCHLMCIHP